MKAFLKRAVGILPKFEFLISLLTRVVLGWVFVSSGWGKFTHLDRTIEFFQSLNIPMAQYQAPVVALLELVCGALLIIGLAARFSSLILAGIMAVAIWTAKLSEIEGLEALFEVYEFTYILLLVWLAVRGAGPVSVDRVLGAKSN